MMYEMTKEAKARMTNKKRIELESLVEWLNRGVEPEVFIIQDHLDFYGSIVQESKGIEVFQSLVRAIVTHRNQGDGDSLETLKEAIVEAHFFVNTLLVMYHTEVPVIDRLLNTIYYKSKELARAKELLNKIEP